MTITNLSHIFLKNAYNISIIDFVMYAFNETLSFYQIRMCYHVDLSLRGRDIYVIERKKHLYFYINKSFNIP